MKAKNGFYNIVFSLAGQIITIVLGLIIPRLFTLSFGSATNGLMTTINQIFAYFTIIEAGIGVTTLQSLYKPVGEDDKNSINSILSATNKYYKKVSLVYFIFLVIFSFSFASYCFFIDTSYLNDSKIIACLIMLGTVFFTGFGNVINFAVQEKFKLILEAEGKKYITTNTQTLIVILTNISKIILLLCGFNLLVIQISYFVINLLQVCIIYLYIKKKYKWIDLSVKPNYAAISQKNSVLVHQVSSLIFANTDVLILTIVKGPQYSSIYAMYKLIFTMLSTLLLNVSGGLSFIFGQTFSQDKKQYTKYLDVYDTYYQAIGFSLYTIALIMLIPFMKLYTAGMDINYIDYGLPYLFVAIEILMLLRNSSQMTINVAGHFKKTQWRSMFESIINLVTSLILVFKFGMYGVLIGTIIALLYRTNDMIIYSNKKILGRSPKKTYFIAGTNLVIMAVIILISSKIPINADGFVSLIGYGVTVSIIIMPIYLFANSLLNLKEFKIIASAVKNKLKK